MLEAYRAHVAERAQLGIPPLPLTAQQTADVIELLKNPPAGEGEFLLDLMTHRVPAGVDDAAHGTRTYACRSTIGRAGAGRFSGPRAWWVRRVVPGRMLPAGHDVRCGCCAARGYRVPRSPPERSVAIVSDHTAASPTSGGMETRSA